MMTLNAEYTSSLVVLNDLGAAADADTVTLTITKPDQTTTVFTLADSTVTRDGLGLYHVTFIPTDEGLYQFAWTTTNPARAQTDYESATGFRSIVSIDDVKSFINFNPTSNEDLLRQIMMAATELIEEVVGTCVIRTFTNERIPGGYQAQVLKLSHGPLVDDTSITSISSVRTGGPTWTQANNDFIVYPDSATVELASYLPFYFGPWKATYTAGRTIVPQKIRLAAFEICYDMWATQRPYGMDSLEPGPEETAKWEMMINTYKIPPHAMAMLLGEERPGFR